MWQQDKQRTRVRVHTIVSRVSITFCGQSQNVTCDIRWNKYSSISLLLLCLWWTVWFWKTIWEDWSLRSSTSMPCHSRSRTYRIYTMQDMWQVIGYPLCYRHKACMELGPKLCISMSDSIKSLLGQSWTRNDGWGGRLLHIASTSVLLPSSACRSLTDLSQELIGPLYIPSYQEAAVTLDNHFFLRYFKEPSQILSEMLFFCDSRLIADFSLKRRWIGCVLMFA